MNIAQVGSWTVVALVTLLTLGCEPKKPADGPAEKAGESVDEAAAKTKEAGKEAVGETKEAAEDAKKKVDKK